MIGLNNKEAQTMIKETIKSLLDIREEKFSASKKHSMFSTADSFLIDIGNESFNKRKVLNGSTPSSNANLGNLNCNIIEGNIQQIVVNNAKYIGEKGTNLLSNKPIEEEFGSVVSVCKISDLEAVSAKLNKEQTESFRKIKESFSYKAVRVEELCECGSCSCSNRSKDRCVMKTIDFSKGRQCLELEVRKLTNKYLIQDYFILHMPKNIKRNKPLQLISICNLAVETFIQERICIYAEEGASTSFIQCTDSDSKTNAIVNNLCEIILEKGACLEYISLHNMNNNCVLYNNLHAIVNGEANLNTFFISFNGGKTDNTQEVSLVGEESSANCYGLYLSDDSQTVANHIKINHLSENTKSRQFFKGVLDDSASGSFKGHIFVEPRAQQTEAYQSSKNLLISPKAQFKTKPYLEIYADNVKCSHGASVGQIDERALFYMRCRGISELQARKMLMNAFTLEVLSEVSVEKVKESLLNLVNKRLSGELSSCDSCVLNCKDDAAICNK